MSDKITSSPLAAALLAAGLTLGTAGAASAATPAVLNQSTSTPTVSSLLAMDEDGRLVVEEKIFDDALPTSEFDDEFAQELADIIVINSGPCQINNVEGCGGKGGFA